MYTYKLLTDDIYLEIFATDKLYFNIFFIEKSLVKITKIHPVSDRSTAHRGGSGFPREEGRQAIIRPNFPDNCMKMKKIGPRGESGRPKFYYVDPPLAHY